MDKEKLEALIIDYLDGQLNGEDRMSLEKELAENPDARLLYEQLREVINAIDRSEHFEWQNLSQKKIRYRHREKSIQ